MLSYNCMQKGSAMARAGNLTEGRAIMKGFKRGMQTNIRNSEQAQAYKEMENQIGKVYAHMGVEMHACDSDDEEILQGGKNKMSIG